MVRDITFSASVPSVNNNKQRLSVSYKRDSSHKLKKVSSSRKKRDLIDKMNDFNDYSNDRNSWNRKCSSTSR